MIESDYIMRMITQLTQAIINLFKLRAEKDFPRAYAEIDRGCKRMLGVELSFLDAFSEQQLIEFFGKDPEFAPSRWYVMGVLLKERAELERLEGKEERAEASEEKALQLLLEAYLDAGPVVPEDHPAYLETLIGRCGKAGFSRSLLLNVERYYEKAGMLAKAEDLLLDLLDAYPEEAAVVESFYLRLLQKPDEELERGRLPREEVIEGLAKARQKKGLG